MKKLIVILFLLPMFSIGQNRFEKKFKELDSTTSTKIDTSWSHSAHNFPNVFVEWEDYLKDCNELVPDTIQQTGTVKCELVPIKMNGKVVSYSTIPVDTVWNDVKCREYQIEYDSVINPVFNSQIGGSTIVTNTGNITWYTNIENTTLSDKSINFIEGKSNYNFTISRYKVCKIKKRKASWDDFWNRWCVERKLVEFN